MFLRYLLVVFCIGMSGGCSLSPPKKKIIYQEKLESLSIEEQLALKTQECRPVETSQMLPLFVKQAEPEESGIKFSYVMNRVDNACKSCHLAPKLDLGGFAYLPQLNGEALNSGGETKQFPGLYEAADDILRVLKDGSMPPAQIRDQNPDDYVKLAEELELWISEGKKGDIEVPLTEGEGAELPAIWGLVNPEKMTDLGDCIPEAGLKGTDPVKDYHFANATSLPALLSETDLFTMDAHQLAKRGTFAYNVEYPLWSDHAGKQRWVHVPAKVGDGQKFEPNAIAYEKHGERAGGVFKIPDNTRFYKTFFKGIKDTDGVIRYKPVETRIIVVRQPPQDPLYGTYIWKDDLSDATLLTEPYRDGSPWKDFSVDLRHDYGAGSKRPYIVPAKHRCVQCHMGAENQSGVVGFTPLQINRRQLGSAGRTESIGASELDLKHRLVGHGVLGDFKEYHDLPRLEYYPSQTELNDHTLRAQGYFLGNCAHCHNPKGFATVDGGISFDLSEGKIFNFNTHLTSKRFTNKKLIHHNGDLDGSYMFFRLTAPLKELRSVTRMPLHTPGAPDCQVVDTVGKWIKTFDRTLTLKQIDELTFDVECNQRGDFSKTSFHWIDDDPTIDEANYAPRRDDWPTAITQDIRSFSAPDGLKAMIDQEFPLDWWRVKDECEFPDRDPLPEDQQKPWMNRKDHKFLYYNTAGAYAYNLTCVKCHGREGTGDGVLSQDLYNFSGGLVRVANFKLGMFGQDGGNLARFDQDGVGNLAAPYFIWMALEGTKMNPPPELTDLLGKHQAQMLKQLGDRCERLIPSHPKNYSPVYRDYELLAKVCGFQNMDVQDPRLAFDPQTDLPVDQVALDGYRRVSMINFGWLIFDYVKEHATKGMPRPSKNECEKVWGKVSAE